MRFDRKKFFDGLRASLLKTISQRQVDGLEFLLRRFESSADEGVRVPKEAAWNDLRHIAYALATIGHETAWTFQPIREYRNAPGTKGRANQDRYWLSGYYGRGYVQLTWQTNYERAGRELGIDLAKKPDLALYPNIAFDILTRGMHAGWFTGKKLSDYINAARTDYVNARRIINGTDRAAQIAGYAQRFEAILTNSRVVQPVETFEGLTEDEIVLEVPGAEEPERDPQTDPLLFEPAIMERPDAPIPQAPAPQPIETVEVDAPEPTRFMAKLKTHLAAILAFMGGGAGLKEWLGIQLSEQTAQLLTVLLPTVLGLGFLGILAWYISEKVIGFKTLQMQSEIAADPERPNLRIRPQ